MIGDLSQGGIKMTRILSFCHALKFSWVKTLLDPLHHAGWKSLFLDKVENLGGDFWMFSKPALGTDHQLEGEGGGGYGFLFRSKKIFRTTQELEYFFLSR